MELRPSSAKPEATAARSGVVVGMKRQREPHPRAWSELDADGDRRMESDADDTVAMCASDEEDPPSRKRAMLIKTNLRFLEKLPPLRDYQRARNGRRGAIDGGTVTGSMMMTALEESFEETSFVTMEPPAREAMVAPTPLPLPTSLLPRRASRDASHAQISHRIGPMNPINSEKDDEARPASE